MGAELTDELKLWFPFVVPTRLGAKIEVRSYEPNFGFADRPLPLWLKDLESGMEFVSGKIISPPANRFQSWNAHIPEPGAFLHVAESRIYQVVRSMVVHEGDQLSCALILQASLEPTAYR